MGSQLALNITIIPMCQASPPGGWDNTLARKFNMQTNKRRGEEGTNLDQADVFAHGSSINLSEVLQTHPERLYPKHLFDPQRRSIAVEILGKELAKLVGAKDNGELAIHRQIVSAWFEGSQQELSPVHDFWSTFDLLMLVKTKRLCRFVTAENVRWGIESLELDDLTLTWMPFIENHPEFGPGPWPIPRIKSVFIDHPDLYAKAKEENDRNRGFYKFDRTTDPIIIVKRGEGQKMYFLDGNGRLYGALMAGRNEIDAWVGHMDGPKPVNYWVSTGELKNLCYIAQDSLNDGNQELHDAAIKLIQNAFEESAIAIVNYRIWIQQYFPGLNQELSKYLGETE